MNNNSGNITLIYLQHDQIPILLKCQNDIR